MNTFKANPTNIWVKFDSPEASLHHFLCIPYESDGSRHKLGHSRLFVGISFCEIDRTSSLGSREVNEGLRRSLEALEIVKMVDAYPVRSGVGGNCSTACEAYTYM